MENEPQSLQRTAPPAHSQSGTDLSQLLPVAAAYVESLSHKSELEHQAQMRDADLTEKDIEFDRHRFNWIFLLVCAVVLFFLGLSAALILWKNDTRTGQSILSHVAMFTGGLLAGLGFRRRQESGEE